MTVVADERKCVQIPTAKPGDRFDLQPLGEGKWALTKLVPDNADAKVTVFVENGFSVGKLEHPIDERALTEALRDLP